MVMSQELRTVLRTLLPPTCCAHLTEVTLELACVRLQLTITAPAAACPRCAEPSSSVHSRYQRQLMDLPWGPLAVRIRLLGRKFVCRNPACTCHICTQRVPELVAPNARKTHWLIAALQATGVALCGQAGARLAHRLGLPASRDTLLRLVRRLPLPNTYEVPSCQGIHYS
jgi:transposase